MEILESNGLKSIPILGKKRTELFEPADNFIPNSGLTPPLAR
jgi:hypothetical protein